MPFSQYQQEIFSWLETGSGSAVIIAVAGGGKTTTIVEAARRIPEDCSAAFVAFNKSIALELKSRVPAHVRVQTLNAMGFSAWMRHIDSRNITVDAQKTRNIMYALLPAEEADRFGNALVRLAGLAKSIALVPQGLTGYGFGTADTEQLWMELMDRFAVDIDTQDADVAIDYGRAILRESIAQAREIIDFDDQLYMPVISGARFWQNDFLFVDEAQDVNLVQRKMLRRALRPTGRLIAVGDPYQAIYGFRGADTHSIENIKREFRAIELPLSVSYRCARAVITEAQRHVDHIEPSPDAAEGTVQFLPGFDPRQFRANDGMVCRNTAPLIETAFKLIRNRVACKVMGREIGAGIIALIKQMKARTIDGLQEKLHTYAAREGAKLKARGQEAKAAALDDKLATIQVFMDALAENRRTISALISEIESLFSDTEQQGMLTLATIHKAKGLEWERVFILNPELMPSKYARMQWQKDQERNLQYVAITRAKSELYYLKAETIAVPEQAAAARA